ncbi:hypothetical protein VQ643_00995 [Pseudomonas sp. F1_0610]|uniref:hypothetical protein n=1 Tax=Pseudomonas sp. F1_0610 TaxID=3114284 RepID=UPI0039C17E5E
MLGLRQILVKEALSKRRICQFLELVFNLPSCHILISQQQDEELPSIADWSGIRLWCQVADLSGDARLMLNLSRYEDSLSILNGLCYACIRMQVTAFLDIDNHNKYLCIEKDKLYPVFMDEERVSYSKSETAIYFYTL